MRWPRPGGRAYRRRGGLLWQRDFRLLWTGETTSELGTAVAQVALPLVAVTVLHASTFLVGLLTAAVWLPWTLLGLPAGAWVDRLPGRPVMLACDAVSLLLFASVPAAAWAGVLTMAQLLAVALLAGAADVFFSTAYRVYLPALVDAGDLTEGNAKLQGSREAAQVGGPGLGGVLAQAAGPALGVAANAVSFAVSAVCLLAIGRGEPARSRSTSRPGLRREIREGVGFLAGDRYMRPWIVYAAAVNLSFTGVDALLVVFLVRTVGIGAGLVGATVGLIGVGGILGAVVAGRLARALGTARATLTASLVTVPFMLVVPLTGRGPDLLLAGGYAVTAAGVVIGNVTMVAWMQAYCPPHLLGRVSATAATVAYCAMPVGAALAGGLGSALGIRPALWVMGCAAVASTAILVFSPVRGIRDLPARPPEGAGELPGAAGP